MINTINKLIRDKPCHIDFRMKDNILECKQAELQNYIQLGELDSMSNIEIGEGCIVIDYLKRDDTGEPYTLHLDEYDIY